jgi:hypothetical protein
MNDNDLRDTLTVAYSDIALTDTAATVMRRGNRLRRARRASRGAYAGVAALTAVSLGVVATTSSQGGSEPIRLVAYSLPALPVSLNPVPDGLDASFDYDMKRLIAFYIDAADDAAQADPALSLRALDEAAEDDEATSEAEVYVQGQPGQLYLRDLPGEADDVATVIWENKPGTWVALTGRGQFSTKAAILAQAKNVTNEPLPLNMRLEFAPSGWELIGYKVVRPGGAVLAMSDGEVSDADARRLTVALYTAPYVGLVPEQMEDPGPVTQVDIKGRTGELMEGARGWFLQVPLDGSTYITMQAPKDLTRKQVIQMASGVSRN